MTTVRAAAIIGDRTAVRMVTEAEPTDIIPIVVRRLAIREKAPPRLMARRETAAAVDLPRAVRKAGLQDETDLAANGSGTRTRRALGVALLRVIMAPRPINRAMEPRRVLTKLRKPARTAKRRVVAAIRVTVVLATVA